MHAVDVIGVVAFEQALAVVAALAAVTILLLLITLIWLALALRKQTTSLARAMRELAADRAPQPAPRTRIPLLGELPAVFDQTARAVRERAALQAQLEQTIQGAYDELRVRSKRRKTRLARANRALTERVDRLRESQARYRAVIGRTADGFFLANTDNKRIIEFNPAFRQLLGYDSAETRTLVAYDFIAAPRAEIDASFQQILTAGDGIQTERRFRRRDGTYVDVEVSASRLFYRGRDVFCAMVHDVTNRKRNQRELSEKNRLLEDAVRSEREAHDELKKAQSYLVQSEKLAGLGQMVAGVAHEINNPLAFVINNLAVLRRDVRAVTVLVKTYQEGQQLIEQHAPELSNRIAAQAERIDLAYTLGNLEELFSRSAEGMRRIRQIVLDLRNFARLDESDLNEVDLNAGIASTANIVQGRARKKDVRIELDLQSLPPVACWPAKINQVMMNLIANAIDASDAGSAVTVRSRLDGPQVLLEVLDHGHGIDAAVRGRIFDPFFTTKPQGEGTGLGLSISYGIVRDHGGTIEVESVPGQGSHFTVCLPLHPPAQEGNGDGQRRS